MKMVRIALPLLALAGLLSSGCVLTSAQVLASFALPSPLTVSGLAGVPVDLNTVGEYRKHRDKLDGVADLAILGRFTNWLATETGVLVYVVPDETRPLYLSTSELLADPTASRVWGPFTLPAGSSATTIAGDQSAALFGAGRAALVNEIEGDGKFTLYFVAAASLTAEPSGARPAGATDVPRPRFALDSGALTVVLDTGL
jgi:hypothetical protein